MKIYKLESTSFEYDKEWLNRPEKFALEPAIISNIVTLKWLMLWLKMELLQKKI